VDLLGYTPEEWMADDTLWRLVVHPDDLPDVLARNETAVDTLSMEYRALHRDGGIVHVHDEAVLIPADGDRPAYWQGIMVDVTATRVQDEALHELTQSLQGVFVASPLAIIVLEPDGRVRHWNPAAERMFGWTAREVVGRPPQYVPEDRWHEFVDLLDRSRAGEPVTGFETVRLRKDGSPVAISMSTARILDADEMVTGLIAVLEDITDRHRAEEDRRLAHERQRRLAGRLELLHQLDRDMLSSSAIDEMAGRALNRLAQLVPFDRGSVTVVDPRTGRFTYVATRHSEELSPLTPNLESHAPDERARELLSRDVLIGDLTEHDVRTPHFDAALALGIRSVIHVALMAGDAQVGTLGLASTTPQAFDEEALDIAREVGAELAVAVSQMRLRQAVSDRAEELARVAEERQQMLRRVVRAQEEERERVALELHDGLGQILTSISLFASDLSQEIAVETRPRAMRVNELALKAIADSRQLVWSLRPPELERLGLVPALRRLVDDVSMPDLTVDLLEEIGDARLEPEAEAVIYRVVQEAVHNAQKHADASAISILLQRHDGQLTTLVEDNGRGFDPAAIPAGRGLGLIGMRERAELVRGSLVVESGTDAGTRVRLLVPIGATPGGGAAEPAPGEGKADG
jgi:PAS domain S-box-containing protein